MQRGAENLSAGRSEDLSGGDARADLLFELGGEREERSEPGRDVEGGEDGEGIPQGEKRVARQGDASLRNRRSGGPGLSQGPEHARKLGIFVEA